MKIIIGLVLLVCAYFFYDPVMTLLHQSANAAGTGGTILAYALIGAPIFLGIGFILAGLKRKSCLFFINVGLVLAAVVLIMMLILGDNTPEVTEGTEKDSTQQEAIKNEAPPVTQEDASASTPTTSPDSN